MQDVFSCQAPIAPRPLHPPLVSVACTQCIMHLSAEIRCRLAADYITLLTIVSHLA